MIENLNGLVGHFTCNARRWRNGGMLVRWIGAAIQDAHGRFRKLRGYRDLAALIRALERTAMDSRKEVASEPSPEPPLTAVQQRAGHPRVFSSGGRSRRSGP